MSYTIQKDGRYHIPIIALGERLQNNFGLTIREHPHFDPVDPVHSRNSYHYADQAIDVQDHRDDIIDGVDWRTRTGNLENLLKGSGVEVFGPNSGVRGHGTHLHLAAEGGIFKLNQQQYDTIFGGNAGGKFATFTGFSSPITPQEPDGTPKIESVSDSAPLRQMAKEKAKAYSDMSKAEMNAAYDALRASDPAKAQIEGMKMHKAFFNK